jgi:hypothetical protein
VGFLGVIAAFFWRRRRAVAPAPVPDPAEELRAKLAATRAAEPPTAPEPAPAPPDPADPAERRRDVHAEARAAIEKMRGSGAESTDSP